MSVNCRYSASDWWGALMYLMRKYREGCRVWRVGGGAWKRGEWVRGETLNRQWLNMSAWMFCLSVSVPSRSQKLSFKKTTVILN